MKPVTSALVKIFRSRCYSIDVVVAGVFSEIFGLSGLFLSSKSVFDLQKLLLQLLQMIFLFNKSEDSKGIKVVTSCNRKASFVTNCYKVVTSCYNWLLQSCYMVEVNTGKGFAEFQIL